MRRVVPIYLVVNTSRSMAGRLVEIEHVLAAFADELLFSPILGDRVRVCVVAFSDSARCVLPLSDLTGIVELPKLVPGRETRFAPMFDLLTSLTDVDASAHLAAGLVYDRPLALLVTDGVPADPGWQRAFDRFYRHAHPRIVLITIGVGAPQAEEMGSAMRVSSTRMLGDAPDQPMVSQIKVALMEHLAPLATSRRIIRPVGE
ncbi:vWA domain-containing protein [Streptosporangium roseum]|uniref:Uncharacterized protein encoded in toxicity protection region of plasmid 478 contains von Willebrand factor (VWF) domain n=1 Tax=Streptosporangium roseum (strain ATCC 12428 / DSM 43021 / JCM 3005 / KCTC 9067 / NCIMB 10171 / NRRL 2505 / NI 9100) TaxID=479432 RepID=D2AQW9_STRRD|nr:hypothetical protein [Streptosporangium roseum]ACZ86516.1 Uncharacterized protein encoded in toxicity protection region of plasmid 478 contains von Willebrand factor (vWF) domain [Streptosporangium roseum DSM 43021]